MQTRAASSLPLEGVRVLDLSRALAGPFCSMILADLGAEVIKAEPARGGDMTRSWGPFDRGVATYFLSINRNKKSLALDFRDARGMELLRCLARQSDVLIENFKPGVVKKMGLDYASLAGSAPRLVYTSVTGFGTEGPYGKWPGFDQVAQGMSGMMSLTGASDGLPTRLGVPLGDLVAGMWSATGTIAALHHRHITGRGQAVETSLLSGLAGMLCVQGQRYLSLGEVPGRVGNDHPVLFPYGAFQAADAPMNIAAATQGQWEQLCKLLELPHLLADPRFKDNDGRASHREPLRDALNAALSKRSANYWTELLMNGGVPAGPIFDLQQLFEHPQAAALGLVETVEHPELGTLKQLSNPLRLESVGSATVRTPPPLLGQHTDQVLGSFDLGNLSAMELRKAGVITQHAIGPQGVAV